MFAIIGSVLKFVFTAKFGAGLVVGAAIGWTRIKGWLTSLYELIEAHI